MPKIFRIALGLMTVLAACLSASAAMAQKAPKKLNNNNVQVSTYGDWEVRCPKSNANGDKCEMTQLINSPDNGKPIMRVVMGYPPQIKTAAMIFILPLGTRLAPGVEIKVDNGKENRFPFQICLQQGCRADYPIDNALLAKMKAGQNATVSIIGPKGDRIDLKVSLNGFTDANNKIK